MQLKVPPKDLHHFRHIFTWTKSSVQNCREYPQVYLIHGPAREGHRGLVERFRETVIQEYADFISGTKTSLGVWEFDWSYKLDVENAKQQLMEWLIIRSHKDDPKYRFERQKYSAVTFREALAALPKVIVVQHTIEADKWTPTSGQLIRAYLEFWDEVKKDSDIPQFVIFLNVVYQAVLRVSVWKPWRKWNEFQQGYNRKRIKAELNQICSLPGRQPLAIRDGIFCLCTLLEELSCVRISHLQKWFEKYHLGRNEVAWETQSKNIFGRRGWYFDECINMVDIEDALDEFIEIMRTSSNDIVSMRAVR